MKLIRQLRSAAILAILIAICGFLMAGDARADTARTFPVPMDDHPGNIFLQGEKVLARVPANLPDTAAGWQARDDQSKTVAEGSLARRTGENSVIDLGPLGVGWYEVAFLDGDGRRVDRTTCAVLARLDAPTPEDSPVCLDAAISWFAQGDTLGQDRFASLAALAGANWIRDRLRWRELEPERGTFVPQTQYDAAARIEHEYGLNVLQVWHSTPPWASSAPDQEGHLPPDLRDVYNFAKAMAVRFKGNVQAWEPWNEANAPNFGGQTIDEICSYQKAAYLGFKAGDPEVSVSWQPIAGANTPEQVDGILANRTWPYYDTYSIHSYDWPESYDHLWEPARRAACGRPIWLTESDRGMKAEPGSVWGDYSPANSLRKAEFIAQSCATSLYAGAALHFQFILGYYMEQNNTVQFGLLRRDLTPRPSYVALAAVGRLLAGAHCLGRWPIAGQPDAQVYAFRGRPFGQDHDVLVAWYEKPGDWDARGSAQLDWSLPGEIRVDSVYDYLGRKLEGGVPGQLRPAPIFVVLPKDGTGNLPLEAPRTSEPRKGKVSPVVLQLEMPARIIVNKTRNWTPELARGYVPDEACDLHIVAYDFGQTPVSGTVDFDGVPSGWTVDPDHWDVNLKPMDRVVLKATLTVASGEGTTNGTWVQVHGTFPGIEPSTLAFRMFPRGG